MRRKRDTMNLCRQCSADSKIATICISAWLLTAITERFQFKVGCLWCVGGLVTWLGPWRAASSRGILDPLSCYCFAAGKKKGYNVSKEETNLIQHDIPMISILHSTCRDSVPQSWFLSKNDMSLSIFRDSNWLVVSNMNFIFHFIYGMSSFPLTNSIIFQDGFLTTYQCWSIAISTYFVDCMVPFPGHGQVDVYNFRRRAFGKNVPNGGLSML